MVTQRHKRQVHLTASQKRSLNQINATGSAMGCTSNDLAYLIAMGLILMDDDNNYSVTDKYYDSDFTDGAAAPTYSPVSDDSPSFDNDDASDDDCDCDNCDCDD